MERSVYLLAMNLSLGNTFEEDLSFSPRGVSVPKTAKIVVFRSHRDT